MPCVISMLNPPHRTPSPVLQLSKELRRFRRFRGERTCRGHLKDHRAEEGHAASTWLAAIAAHTPRRRFWTLGQECCICGRLFWIRRWEGAGR